MSGRILHAVHHDPTDTARGFLERLGIVVVAVIALLASLVIGALTWPPYLVYLIVVRPIVWLTRGRQSQVRTPPH